MERTTRLKVLALAFLWSLFQGVATADFSDSTTAQTLVTNANNQPSNSVDTCESAKVSTYTREISHQWIIENPSVYFHTSGRSDANGSHRTAVLTSLSQRYINIIFNATFPLEYDNSPNIIMARSFLHFKNITKGASCFDSYPEPKTPGVWEGTCYFQTFESSELEKLTSSGSFTVLFEWSLVYANASQTLANGVECNDMKYQDFKTSQDSTTPASGTTPASVETQFESFYANISKHRVSLEWSIHNVSLALKEPLGAPAVRPLAKLLLPDGIGAFNWLTMVQIRKYISEYTEVELVLGPRSQTPGINLLDIARLQVAFTAGYNYTKVVPVDSIRGGGAYEKATFQITDEELEWWKRGVVVVQMEFEAVYGIHKDF